MLRNPVSSLYLNNVHDWLVVHPILQNCIVAAAFGLIFLLLGRYWDQLGTLLRLPPQKFGDWRRSAKITVLQKRISRLERAHSDFHFYVTRIVISFAVTVGFMAIIATSIEMFLLQTVDSLFLSSHKVILPGPRMHFAIRAMMIAIVMFPITRILSRMYEAAELSANLIAYPDSAQRLQKKIAVLESKKVGRVAQV